MAKDKQSSDPHCARCGKDLSDEMFHIVIAIRPTERSKDKTAIDVSPAAMCDTCHTAALKALGWSELASAPTIRRKPQ